MPKVLTRSKARRTVSAPQNELSQENRRAFRLVLGEDFGRTLQERGIQKDVPVKLFVYVNEKAVEVGTAKLSGAGHGSEIVQRRLHLHELPQTANENLTVVTGTCIKTDMSAYPYPYTFKGGEGPPSILKDMLTGGMYAWDTRMMVTISAPSRSTDIGRPSRLLEGDREDEVLLSPPKKRHKGNRGGRPTRGKLDLGRDDEVMEVAQIVDVTGERNRGPDAGDEVILVSEESLDDRGHNIPVRSYEMSAYRKQEVNVMLSQVLQPHCTLRDVQKAHVEDLKKKLRKYGYDYGSGLMTVTVRCKENPQLPNLKLPTILDDKNPKGDAMEARTPQCLKLSVQATVIDGLHRREALVILQEEEGGNRVCKWLHEPLRMILITRKDGNDISSTELLHLGSQRNQVASTVRPFQTLEDHIFAVTSYLRSFAEEGNISVDLVRPSNLAEEMYNSNLLPNLERQTYRRYARIGKWFAQYPKAFAKLKELKPDTRPKLGLLHLDHSVFFQVDEQGVLLLLDSVDAYVRNPNSTGTFKATSFYKVAKGLYGFCRHAYHNYGIPRNLSFIEFLDQELKLTKTKTVTIRDHFIRQMRLFSAKSKAEEDKNMVRNLRFQSKLKAHFQPHSLRQSEERVLEVAQFSANEDVGMRGESAPPEIIVDAENEIMAEVEVPSASVDRGEFTSTAPLTELGSSTSRVGKDILETILAGATSGRGRDVGARALDADSATANASAFAQSFPVSMATAASEPVTSSICAQTNTAGFVSEFIPPVGTPEQVRTALDEPPVVPERTADVRRSTRHCKGAAPVVVPAPMQKARARKTTLRSKEKTHNAVKKSHIRKELNKEDEDKEGYLIPVKENADETFDDLIPPFLPRGYQDPPVYKGPLNPIWQQAVPLAPSVLDAVLMKCNSENEHVHHTPWLQALHIPLQHRAHLYVNIAILQYLHRLAWCKAAKMQLELAHEEAPGITSFLPENSWESASTRFQNGEGRSYFLLQGERLTQQGFCILKGFGDTTDFPDEVKNLLKQPSGIPAQSLEDMFKHYLSTFPGEDVLKDPKKRTLWNPIVNFGVAKSDETSRDAGKARYSSTRKLLMEVSEEKPSNLWASIRRAILDTWIGLLAVLVGLKNDGNNKLWMPKTGGRLLITGKNCPRQVPHNDFQVPHKNEMEKVPGYFVMVSGAVGFPLWVCDYSHHFVFLTKKDLKRLSITLKVRKLFVPANSVFIGHGYLGHGGGGDEDLPSEKTSTRYHAYLVPDDRSLPDSVFYAFGDIALQHSDQKELVERDIALQHSDREKLVEKHPQATERGISNTVELVHESVNLSESESVLDAIERELHDREIRIPQAAENGTDEEEESGSAEEEDEEFCRQSEGSDE